MTELIAPAPGPRSTDFDAKAALTRWGALAAFLFLLVFNLAFTPNFASWQTLNVNLTQVCAIVIVAVGMTLVIATGGIDLSVGSLMAIAGAVAPLIFMGKLFPIPHPLVGVALAFVIPVAIAGMFGLFNGWLITRFRIQPIIATLVLFIAGRGIAQVLTNGNLQAFKAPEFQFIGLGRVFGIPLQAILMVLIVGAAAWMLRRTVFGRQILAVGGTLLTGGKATVVGTLLGALIIQLVRYTLLANGVPDAAALVVKAAIIVVAVWLQRQGRS
jgi:ribose transport system permease protein